MRLFNADVALAFNVDGGSWFFTFLYKLPTCLTTRDCYDIFYSRTVTAMLLLRT